MLDYFKLNDNCTEFEDDFYSKNYEQNSNGIEVKLLNNIHKNFHYSLPILQELYFPYKLKNPTLFPFKHSQPLSIYNDLSLNLYLSEPLSYTPRTKQINSNVVKSHPLLPLYLTGNEKGHVFLWSFNPHKNKTIYEYYLDKQCRDSSVKKNIKKIDFNHYGNQFLTVDEDNSVFSVFEFNHTNNKSTALYSFGNSNRLVKDAAFYNESGVFCSTYSEYNTKYTCLWDSLLPSNSANVGELFGVGGSSVIPFDDQSYLLIANNIQGQMTLIDSRKLQQVLTFPAHTEKVNNAVLSWSNNILCTAGKDGLVKIWDISNKTEAVLIESILPYFKEKNSKNVFVELKEGNLYSGAPGSIKLLRNKII